MLRNYLLVALKVLARRRFFTFISLFGISFTLVVLMVLSAAVEHVVSSNPPQVNIDRTLQISYMLETGPQSSWNGSPGFGFLDRYCRDLPGVEMMTLVEGNNNVVAYPGGRRVELDLRHTDGVYWDVYDFEFLEGGPFTEEDDRAGRFVAVISESARHQYFQGRSAVGQRMEVAGRTYDVIGVVANVNPAYTAADSDVWVPIGAISDPAFRSALMGGYQGILVAGSKDDFPAIRDDFQARLGSVVFPDDSRFDRMQGFPMTLLETVAIQMAFDDPSRDSVAKLLGLVSLLVLAFMLLPAINLINVNLSRIYERMSEIGVRKAFGASSAHLIGQFVFENVVLCGVGGILGFVLSALVLVAVNASNVIPYSDFSISYRIFFIGMALATFFGVLSGLYPAWRMSRLHPVAALKGDTL